MNFSFLNHVHRRLTLALLLGAGAGLLGSAIVMAQLGHDGAGPLPPLQRSDVPIPTFNRWIRPDNGKFEAYLWDNRALSDAQKQAQPWYDPRWQPFGDCMAAAGFEVRADVAKPFAQADLDHLVALVNGARPDGAANKLIASGQSVPGIAGAFLSCADRWLTIDYNDYPANGLRALEPGEVPDP